MRIYWIWMDLSWDLMEFETPTPSTPKRIFFSTLTLLKALSVTTPESKARQPGLAHKALGARPWFPQASSTGIIVKMMSTGSLGIPSFLGFRVSVSVSTLGFSMLNSTHNLNIKHGDATIKMLGFYWTTEIEFGWALRKLGLKDQNRDVANKYIRLYKNFTSKCLHIADFPRKIFRKTGCLTWVWVNTQYLCILYVYIGTTIWRDEDPFTSYFGVHQGYRVLTYGNMFFLLVKPVQGRMLS